MTMPFLAIEHSRCMIHADTQTDGFTAMMSMLILDRDVARELRAERKARGNDQHDEVWEGVYVMSPLADNIHQEIVAGFVTAFHQVIGDTKKGRVFPGVNVSDRVEGWKKNYRTPDVAVVLSGSRAQSHYTFWTGPVDFLVEVVSRGDRSRLKLPFYSKLGVREVLLVHRNPWRLCLYRHDGNKLRVAGRCVVAEPAAIASEVLPFSFRLIETPDRPMIELTHATDGRTWRA